MDEQYNESKGLSTAHFVIREARRMIVTLLMISVIVPFLFFGLMFWLATLQLGTAQEAATFMSGALGADWMKKLSEFIPAVWALLKSVIFLAVIVLMFRWVLLAPGLGLGEHFKRLTSNLHSALAILVIGTLCVMAILDIKIPGVVENIALVIVGYYFGRKHESDQEKKEVVQ